MKGTSNRGFASMDAQRQREIARRGGQAAHQKGTAHEFTTNEAREAGRKGGERVSANRQHMAEIGRRGGQKSSGRRKETTERQVHSEGTRAAEGQSAPRPESGAPPERVQAPEPRQTPPPEQHSAAPPA